MCCWQVGLGQERPQSTLEAPEQISLLYPPRRICCQECLLSQRYSSSRLYVALERSEE
jgi:hypothetical protein